MNLVGSKGAPRQPGEEPPGLAGQGGTRNAKSGVKPRVSPLVGEGGSAKPRRMRGQRVTGPLIRPAGTFSHKGRREAGSGGAERQQLDDV